MDLTKKQKEQVEKQLKEHQHSDYKINIELTEGQILKGFSVHSKVLRPEIMNAMHLARWLFFNNGLYVNKIVIDMGSGTGIQGVVAGLYGAKQVIFSDLSYAAVQNTKENVKIFKLGNKSEVYEGDLFQKIKTKADIIIFNHPFFSTQTMEEDIITKSVNNNGSLIHRFLEDSKKFLTKGGLIVMPYFHLAGEINDPAVQAPKHGYTVKEISRGNLNTGLQKGETSIYILKLK